MSQDLKDLSMEQVAHPEEMIATQMVTKQPAIRLLKTRILLHGDSWTKCYEDELRIRPEWIG